MDCFNVNDFNIIDGQGTCKHDKKPIYYIQGALGVWPIYQKHKQIVPQVGVTHDELDLQRGWIYGLVDKAVDYLVAVRKEKDGTFELSGVMFAIQK